MRVYAMADAVVGLDVDRDSFDKFRCTPESGVHIGCNECVFPLSL